MKNQYDFVANWQFWVNLLISVIVLILTAIYQLSTGDTLPQTFADWQTWAIGLMPGIVNLVTATLLTAFTGGQFMKTKP